MSKFKKKNIVRYKTCWFEFEQNKRRAKSLEKNLHQKKPKKKKKKKRKMSVVWDSDEDSLGADKDYVIKEEGENIPLDDSENKEKNENEYKKECLIKIITKRINKENFNLLKKYFYKLKEIKYEIKNKEQNIIKESDIY